MSKTLRLFLPAAALAVGFTLWSGSTSYAQPVYGGPGYGAYPAPQAYGGAYAPSYGQAYGVGGFTAPLYHPPSVHYDRVYHPTRTHWTPLRGWHTHGHYDVVPHYTPGHFDTLHNGHVDPNPHYHHR
ncbi:MAG TPA: hypothetical protein VIL46_11195 [Gemmataceae bacterium]